MISEFGGSSASQTQWTDHETIDAHELRMFVNAQLQIIRQWAATTPDFHVFFDHDERRVRGISSDDCKILAHEMVDFLLKDEGPPISVRKQCVEDAVVNFQHIVKNSGDTFIGNKNYLKSSKFFNAFIDECKNNLHLFNCIEGRIQNQTSTRKHKM